MCFILTTCLWFAQFEVCYYAVSAQTLEVSREWLPVPKSRWRCWASSDVRWRSSQDKCVQPCSPAWHDSFIDCEGRNHACHVHLWHLSQYLRQFPTPPSI